MTLKTPSKTKPNEGGETIVEVLIATAIISVVLASAFLIVNRNTSAMQDIEEHSYAQKILERQVESLRGYSGALVGDKCFDAVGELVDYNEDVDCTFQNGGASYLAKITDGSPAAKVEVTWQTINGSTATETVYYIR